jgi:phage replication-related protein YjqB (UPF0714/DUF867 family)
VNYRIRWRIENSCIAILSIHANDIEPGSSEVANAIPGFIQVVWPKYQ